MERRRFLKKIFTLGSFAEGSSRVPWVLSFFYSLFKSNKSEAQLIPVTYWKKKVTSSGLFCLLDSYSGGGGVETSPDGVTWTSQVTGAVPTGVKWQDVCWNGSVFCAIQNTGVVAGYVNTRASSDGVTWTAGTLPNNTWVAITCNDSGLFCAIDSTGVVATSPDGITWTAGTAIGSGTWT